MQNFTLKSVTKVIFTDVNVRDLKTIMAFHHLHYLVPTKTKSSKCTWTPSIPESQEAFLLVVKSFNAIASQMASQKLFCDLKGFADHPKIFVVKNTGKAEYCVAVQESIYKCESLLIAVNAAFQVYVLFNIRFPPQCEKVWSFLNQIFFKIDLQEKPTFKMVSIMNSFHF